MGSEIVDHRASHERALRRQIRKALLALAAELAPQLDAGLRVVRLHRERAVLAVFQGHFDWIVLARRRQWSDDELTHRHCVALAAELHEVEHDALLARPRREIRL